MKGDENIKLVFQRNKSARDRKQLLTQVVICTVQILKSSLLSVRNKQLVVFNHPGNSTVDAS